MRLRRCRLLAALLVLAGSAGCATLPSPIVLSGEQTQTVAIAQNYLNSLTLFRAQFTQSGWLGGGVGTLWVARPGRLRMTYVASTAKDIVASDGLFTVLDRSNGAISTTPIARTPLGLLLNERLTFSGAVAVTGFEEDPSWVSLTLADSAHPGQGTLTVRLRKAPFLLVGVTATDIRGRSLSLELSGLDPRPIISADLFRLPAGPTGT